MKSTSILMSVFMILISLSAVPVGAASDDALSVYLNCDFDTDESMAGMSANMKRHIMQREQSDDDNGYFYAEVAGDGDAHLDIDLSTGGVTDIVIEADFKCTVPGMSGFLFMNRGNGFGYLLRLTSSGMVQTYQKQNICTLSADEWTNIALVCDFGTMVYDVYVNGSIVRNDAVISATVDETLQTLRAIYVSGGSAGANLLMDNLKAYEGTAVRELADGEGAVTPESIMPDGSEATEILGSDIAFSAHSGVMYENGVKTQIADSVYMKNGTAMAPLRRLAEYYGYNVRYYRCTNNVKIGDHALVRSGSKMAEISGTEYEMPEMPELIDSTYYVPLVFFAEKILGKNVYWDDRGFAIIGDSPIELSDSQKWIVSDYLLYERPSAEEILSIYNANSANVHPKLIISASDVERIKTNYQNSARVKAWTDTMLKNAEAMLTAPVSTYTKDYDGRILGSSRQVLERVHTLGLAYFIMDSDKAKYAERMWTELEAAGNFPDWNAKVHYLDTGEMMAAFAIAYDWLYDYWSDAQKDFLRERTLNYGLNESYKCYYGIYYGQSGWWPTVNHNWNAITNGGTTLAAIAFMEDYPELCSDLVSHALRGIEVMNRGFYPDGAWSEGSSYWNYLSQYYSMLDYTLHNTFGTDFNLTKAPGLKSSAEFIIAADGPEGTNNYHDSGASHFITYPVMWYGYEFDNPALVAERINAIENYSLASTVYDIMYYEGDEDFKSDSYPLDVYFPGVELVSMRSAYGDENAAFVSYHSGSNSVNHGHYDAGSFVFDLNGERWAMDLGADSYGIAGYFDTNRDKIYRIRAEGHNVLVIDPDESAGQEYEVQMQVSSLVSGNIGAYSITDLTEAYSPYADKITRGFYLGDNRQTLTVRDEIDFKDGSHEIYWFMHTKAEIEIIDSKTAILTLNGKRLKVQLTSNIADASFKVMDAKPLSTSPVLSGQNANSGIRKLTVKGTASESAFIEVRLSDADGAYSETASLNIPLASWSRSMVKN